MLCGGLIAVFMGVLISFGAMVMAAAAALFEGILRNATDRIGTGATA